MQYGSEQEIKDRIEKLKSESESINPEIKKESEEKESKKKRNQNQNRESESKGSKKFEDAKELGYLKELLVDKMPLACEEKVNHRFLDFFKNEPGLFLHGFKPKKYLKRFRELAKEMRNEMSTLKLMDVELC